VYEFGRQPIADAASGLIDPQVQAIQVLIEANREVYYACPAVTPFYQRILKRLFCC
jgi:hypothetical protein